MSQAGDSTPSEKWDASDQIQADAQEAEETQISPLNISSVYLPFYILWGIIYLLAKFQSLRTDFQPEKYSPHALFLVT